MKRLRNDSNIFTLTQSANRVNAFMTKSLKTSNNSRLKSTVPAKRKWLKMEFGPGHASIFVDYKIDYICLSVVQFFEL